MSAVAARSAFMAGVNKRIQEKAAGKKPRSSKGIPNGAWDRAVAEAQECERTGDWTLAEPRHLAALYALLHERVYGVQPAELTPMGRMRCAAAARKLLDREFAGDKAELLAWFRWAWTREKGRHAWRAANGREPTRLGWGYFWSGSLVTDWRLADKGQRR